MAPAEHTTMHESPYQQALAATTLGEIQDFKKNTVPLIQQEIRDINLTGSQPMIDKAGAIASGGVMADADPMIKGSMRSAGLSGATPASGASVMRAANMRSGAAGAMADAGYGAKVGQKDASLHGLDSVLGMIRGGQGQAQASMADVAGQAQSMAERKAEASMANASALGQGMGTMAGLGAYGLMSSKKVA